MNLKALKKALNTKSFVILCLLILTASCVIGGTLLYFAGNVKTTVSVGTGENNDQVYDITLDGVSPPFAIEETLTLLPDESVMIQYPLRNNEEFEVTVNFDISQLDTGLELEITNGKDETLSGNSITLPAYDGKAYYVKFWYHVLDTATEGETLNAYIDVSINS